MKELRLEVFERDGYRCQHVVEVSLGMYSEAQERRCMKSVSWDSGHLAHVVGRGRGGKDEASNLLTKCAHCHLVLEHNPKSVPAKERA